MCVSELGINVPVPVFLLHVTLCLHFVAARDAETLRARQQQQANTVAVAEAALQAQHEETTRLAGEFKGECRTPNFFVERTAVLCKNFQISLFGVSTCSGIFCGYVP